jgi:hypothetical protein
MQMDYTFPHFQTRTTHCVTKVASIALSESPAPCNTPASVMPNASNGSVSALMRKYATTNAFTCGRDCSKIGG